MPSDRPIVSPWSRSETPTASEIEAGFRGDGLSAYAWSNSPGNIYGAHTHPYHEVLHVVRGSITFGLPDTEERITLRAGDRLDLPPGTRHDAVVGPEGVTCMEAFPF